jgi:dihydrolipoamide dehydrogenase
MSENQFDLIVIGAGPGGYVAAIRASQLGMKVACVERQYLGGTCLNVGCIPSKALLDSSERYYAAKNHFGRHGINVGQLNIDVARMMARKDDVVKKLTGGVGLLFKKHKIEHIAGTATIAAPGQVTVIAGGSTERSLRAKNILIATGSAPSQIPSLKFDGEFILSSTEGIAIPNVPAKLLVVGAGYIGVELGSVWSRLGSEVTVLEFLDGCLPASDREMALALQRLLEKQGIKFRFNTAAQGAQIDRGKVKVSWKSRQGTESGVEQVDKVLVAVGRRPVTDQLGLERVKIQLDKQGFIPVDARYQTSVPGIFAIGDVIGGIMLAHKAEEEGVACVELMNGVAGHVNYHCCPAVVYTHPELASVGYTEEQARSRLGDDGVKVGKFPFAANGRARAMDETDGFVKIIADAKSDRVLGCHILGAHASDTIAECVAAMEFGTSSEDLARTFHAHPTLPEAIREAALAVDKRVRQM